MVGDVVKVWVPFFAQRNRKKIYPGEGRGKRLSNFFWEPEFPHRARNKRLLSNEQSAREQPVPSRGELEDPKIVFKRNGGEQIMATLWEGGRAPARGVRRSVGDKSKGCTPWGREGGSGDPTQRCHSKAKTRTGREGWKKLVEKYLEGLGFIRTKMKTARKFPKWRMREKQERSWGGPEKSPFGGRD